MSAFHRSSLVALACLASAPAALAQGLKLNPPLARPLGGDVREFEFVPNGRRVVYRADQEVDELYELFLARRTANGVVSRRLSAPLSTGGDVRTFLVDPTRTHALYAADQEVAGFVELFRVTLATGEVARLSSGEVLGAGDFARVTPDGTSAVFLQRAANGSLELFCAPLDASAPAERLSGPIVANGNVREDYRIDPSGTRVVYAADAQQWLRVDLWAAPIAGDGAPVRLNRPFGGIGAAGEELEITPDGGRVVFSAPDPADGRTRLWVAPIDGSEPALPLTPGVAAPRAFRDVALVADGSAVIYRADFEIPGGHEAWVSPLDGTAEPQSLASLDLSTHYVSDLRPAGARAVLLVRHRATGTQELFGAPLDGSTSAYRISGALVPGGSVDDEIVLTGDGLGVAYTADQRADGVREVFAAPVDGHVPAVRIQELAIAPGSVPALVGFGPLGRTLVFAGNRANAAAVELFAAPTDGSAPARAISGALALGGDVGEVALSDDGTRALYSADAELDDVFSLYGVPIDGSQPPARLSAPMPLGPVEGDVASAALAGGGSRAVYLADQETDGVQELYSVEAGTRRRVRKLSGELAPAGDVRAFRLTRDGNRVVYLADQRADELLELFSVPSDGSAPALRLSGELVAGGDVSTAERGFALSPDGTRVVYAADALVDGRLELFSAPLDGSAAPVRINADLPAGGRVDVGSLLFTPDGTSVVYHGDQLVDEVFELFCAPLDASAPPRRISGALVAGGDVRLVPGARSFELTPDGASVVYAADALADNVLELFRARLDASAAPARISGALVAGGDVWQEFQLSPDGTRVAYLADARVNDVAELFSARVDGVGAPVRLSGALVDGGAVTGLQIARAGGRVLFLADALQDETFELFSAPLDGSATAARLSGALQALGDVLRSPDADAPLALVDEEGTRAVFRADAAVDGCFEVFSAPLDGTGPPVRLNRPFGAPVFASAKADLALSPDSSTVLFRADSGFERIDLFAAPLAGDAQAVVLARGVEGFSTGQGHRLLFRAAPEYDGVVELYLRSLERPVRGGIRGDLFVR